MKMYSVRRIVPAVLLVTACLLPPQAAQAEFRVSPIRLDFTPKVKSGVFTVVNESKDKLNFQVSVSAWLQDESGGDRYEPTSDIVFYPRIMSLAPDGQQVIRVGVKGPPPANERTYRIFIEQIPEPAAGGRMQASVAISIRFAPPLFVRPASAKAKGEIGSLSLEKGSITAQVRNTGNVHFSIKAVKLRGFDPDGKELFVKELKGWYLLHGAARAYTAPVPADVCAGLASVTASVSTDEIDLDRKVNVLPGMCSP